MTTVLPGPSRRPQRLPWVALSLAAAVGAFLAAGCGSGDEPATLTPPDLADVAEQDTQAEEPAGEDESVSTPTGYDCENLVPEVIALSEEQGDLAYKVLAVYQPETVRDRQQRFISGELEFPDGENQMPVLVCEGLAATDTGEEFPISYRLDVDTNDMLFIYYELQ